MLNSIARPPFGGVAKNKKNKHMKNFTQYISIDPGIRFGKPCIKGTRVSVAAILTWLGSGQSNEEIPDDFPLLKPVHIQAALAFAANRSY